VLTEFDIAKLEVPTDRIKVEATFYCIFGGSFDWINPVQPAGEYSPFLHFNPKLAKGGDLRRSVRLPAELEPFWSSEELLNDPEEYTEFLCPLQLRDDVFIPHLTDYISVGPMPIVTPRMQKIIERLDPHGSLFFEAKLLDQMGEEIKDVSYAHWLPRKRFHHKDENATEYLRVPFPGLWSHGKTAWRIGHHQATRSYFSKIPFCGYGLSIGQTCMNAAAFREFRRHKITGLVENTATHEADRNLWENVGHIL